MHWGGGEDGVHWGGGEDGVHWGGGEDGVHWGGGEDGVHPLSGYITSVNDTAQAASRTSPRILYIWWQWWDRPVMRNVTEPDIKS